jgi:hypothetical protein
MREGMWTLPFSRENPKMNPVMRWERRGLMRDLVVGGVDGLEDKCDVSFEDGFEDVWS